MIIENLEAAHKATRAYKSAVSILERGLRDLSTSQRISNASGIVLAQSDIDLAVVNVAPLVVAVKVRAQALDDVLASTTVIQGDTD